MFLERWSSALRSQGRPGRGTAGAQVKQMRSRAPPGEVSGQRSERDADQRADADVLALPSRGELVDGGAADAKLLGHLARREQLRQRGQRNVAKLPSGGFRPFCPFRPKGGGKGAGRSRWRSTRSGGR